MKRVFLAVLATMMVVYTFAQKDQVNVKLLKKLDRLKDVEVVKYEKGLAGFESFFELSITQPLDHNNPHGETFTQRVFVAHRDVSSPVIFVTEGYTANYADNPAYANELTRYLKANQIVVEHRFFNESAPETMQWEYLTVANAAADHHHVVELLKKIYTKNEWLNTGISKGGQTATYHRYYYPEDVDVTVGYVCPINFSREEQRVYSFLQNVGTEECRTKIKYYQDYMLENKKDFLPAFEYLTKKQKLTFSMGAEAAYELAVCEYPFAFWQWGADCNSIPGPKTMAKDAVKHLGDIAGFDFFAEESKPSMQPFFYQALTEIGMYGYDFSMFDGKITAAEDNTFMFFMPENTDTTYNYNTMRDVDSWIQNEADNIIWLYGEYDPWSAPAARAEGNEQVLKIVKPQGSHKTRIRNLPEDQKKKVFDQLDEWLEAPIYRNAVK